MTFLPSDRFMGSRPGYVFKLGDSGLGYYAEELRQVVETWTFGSHEVRVKVDESCGVCYTGLRIWPAAEALAKLLATDEGRPWQPEGDPGDVRVLELGAGCGLVAAVAGRVFGRVVAADGPRAVRRRLAETAALNRGSFEVRKITWGENPPLDPDQDLENEVDAHHGNCDFYDLILGADITYDCSFPMISSLLDLISSFSHDETWTLLAHGVRSSEKALDLWKWLRQRWPQAQLLRSGEDFSDRFEEMMEGAQGALETPVVIFALKGKGGGW
eukprot:s1644_g18.t1